MQHDDRLIVALDFPTLEQAKACVVELGDAVSYYKVGMELYYAVGSEIIRFLKEHGKHVFLDLKLQDIPNTVAHALTVLSDLGADMMNVHAVGGKKMMAEAVKAVHEAAEAAGRPPGPGRGGGCPGQSPAALQSTPPRRRCPDTTPPAP